MTINKARQILGSEVKDKSDEQVQEIVNCINCLVEVGFEQFESYRKVKHQVKLESAKKLFVPEAY